MNLIRQSPLSLTLARQGEDLIYRPHIPMLDEDNARQGFVDHGGFLAILDGLRDYLKDVAWFLYLTGLRIGAVRRLEHRHIDWEGKIIMLPQELAKNKKGQPIPIRGELLELMERVRVNRVPNCPYLFHRDGRQIGDFRKVEFRSDFVHLSEPKGIRHRLALRV